MKSKFSKVTLLILLLAFVVTTMLVPASAFATTSSTRPTNADEVEYVTSGNYRYNWGVRGETSTFLSKYAQAFYTDSYTWENLSKVGGGSSQSNAPSSALYSSLQTLMKSKHSYETSYGATRNLYRYTDCEKSNTTNISSFYSGTKLSSDWGSGWNREHTWPNSKGLNGNDENDIMMLRPTATSENSSRGNTAYGQSSGYYNPDCENPPASLKGDVARICLYVYTRWGNTGKMWGSSGVMESLNVLLQWMKEDPVDTWEMGRNDAVQAITGTRNVFVDYPEYAWLLFGKDVPKDYSTPSSNNGTIAPDPDIGGDGGSTGGDGGNTGDGGSTTTPVNPDVSATIDLTSASNKVSATGDKLAFASGNLKVTIDKAESKSDLVDQTSKGYAARVYSGATLTVEYSKMTKIVLNCYGETDSNGKTYYSGFDGMTVDGATITRDGTVITITFANPTDKFVSASVSSQVRIESIEVYTSTDGGTIAPDPDIGGDGGSTGGDGGNTGDGGSTTTPVNPDVSATIDLTSASNKVSATGDKLAFASGNLKVTIDKAESKSDLVDQTSKGYAARVYSGATLTVEYSKMTKIVLNCYGETDSNGKTYYSGFDGMTVDGATITRDGTVITITFANPTDKFVSASVSSQVRIESIEVYTSTDGGSTGGDSTGGSTGGDSTGGTTGGDSAGGDVTPPIDNPTHDQAVESFKTAVANIANATTINAQYNAIKTAVTAYNALTSAQKQQLSTEIATLKTAISNYNTAITTQNSNANDALNVVLQTVVAAAVALVVAIITKKVLF